MVELTPESTALLDQIRSDIAGGDYTTLANLVNSNIQSGNVAGWQLQFAAVSASANPEVAARAIQEIINGFIENEANHVTVTTDHARILGDIANASNEQILGLVTSISGQPEEVIITSVNTFTGGTPAVEASAPELTETFAAATPPPEQVGAEIEAEAEAPTVGADADDPTSDFRENAGDLTDPPRTQADFDAEFAAARQAVSEYEAGLRARGEEPPGESIGYLVNMLGIFSGQDGENGGIGDLINNYRAQGAGLEYEVVPGGFGIMSLISLMGSDSSGPVQIPEEAFLFGRNMAIEQIAADPNILLSITGEDGEPDPQMILLAGQISALGEAERNEFKESLEYFLEGRIDFIRVGDIDMEFNATQILQMRRQFDDMVGQTLAAGINDIGGVFAGTGLFEMIGQALEFILNIASEMAQNFGLNVDLAEMLPDNLGLGR